MAQPLLFTPLCIREFTRKNRVVVAPMHQYSAVKGFPADWHLTNVERYAAAGADDPRISDMLRRSGA